MGNLETLGIASGLSSSAEADSAKTDSAKTDSTKIDGASVIRLPSGLSIIHQEMATPAVAVDVWVDAGARQEPDGWGGMAHFLEHMVFKGTQRLRPGEFDWALESRGGVSNAATSHDYAHYYITVAVETLSETLPYLAELVLGAAIPDGEFDSERNVVLEEIRQANDDPDWVGYQALCHLLYGQHAYGKPVLGTPETLQTFSPEKMRQFHAAHYQPKNITVAIAGNLPQQQAVSLVESAFARFPSPTSLPADIGPLDRSARAKVISQRANLPLQRQVLHLPHLEQCRLTLAWIGPGVDNLEAASHLDLISVVLGGGRTARLVRELREEKQLVQDVDVDFSLQKDCGEFGIALWLEESNLDLVEEIVRDRINDLCNQLISPSELARAKRLLLNDYAFSIETPGQIAGLYGYYATLGDPHLATLYPQYLQSATAADLQKTAQNYLSPDRYTAVTLKPEYT